MLPSTRHDLYDNDKTRSKRGWGLFNNLNVTTSSLRSSSRPQRRTLFIFGLISLVIVLSFFLFYSDDVTTTSYNNIIITSSKPPALADRNEDGLLFEDESDNLERDNNRFNNNDNDDQNQDDNDAAAESDKGNERSQNDDDDDDDGEGRALIQREQGEEEREVGFEGEELEEEGEGQGEGEGGQRAEWTSEKEQVVEAFRHAWKGYKTYAWGDDELHPLSRRGSNWFTLGLTLVDSLDLMLFMGLTNEFNEASAWVRDSMAFTNDGQSNLFEVTIRVLGGLLSAHALTGDDMFVDKARNLGDRLMSAFSSGTPIPLASVNLRDSKGVAASHNGGDSSTAEVATIQLEFTALSHVTGNSAYAEAADKVIRHLRTLPKTDGLVPIFINPYSGQFSGNTIRLGSRGDSYYEYLLKQWLHTGKTESWHREMYDEAIAGIKKRLLQRSKPSGLLYVAELENGHLSPKMDHLVCFLPGVLALGATHGKTEAEAKSFMTANDLEDLEIAKELTYTCYQMYERMPTKLAPEIVFFNTGDHGTEDITVKPADAHNLLRPETIESIFILYRITRDEKYREWGWKMFMAFETHTKVENGYTSIDNVKDLNGPKRDKMESFFLGETLKYFYLLFSKPSLIPLDRFVFNTEAHPLPILPKGLKSKTKP